MGKYDTGKIIEVEVSRIEKYGIFVNIDKSYCGLIHISEITNNFVKSIYDYVDIGERIQAKIICVNEKKHQIKLSIKDIEYRMNKRKNTILKETNSGFLTLATKLDKWIEEKTKEITNKNQKNNKKTLTK